MKNLLPIGIFDSGIGGLTSAKTIREKFPHLPIIYYGDNVHFPYGEKTAEQIQSYAKDICDFLLSKSCKTILIACNSASAVSYEFVCEYVGDRAKVYNVIDPVVEYISKNYPNKKIGLIATARTVNSNAYGKKAKTFCPKIDFRSVATADLAPMIEQHMNDGKYDIVMIEQYLSHPQLKDIDVLILGCTHYPLIKKEISVFLKSKVEIIDTSEIIVKSMHLAVSQNKIPDLEMISFHFSKKSTQAEKFIRQLFPELI